MILRMALRGLMRDRRFSVVAILTLALGLGASVAIFAIADGMLLRPLPFPQSDRLVALYRIRSAEGQRMALSRPLLEDIAQQCGAFSTIGGYRSTAPLAGDGGRLQVPALEVTSSLLHELGTTVVLGRALTNADQRPGAPPVALISHSLWTSHYGGSRNVIGQTLRAQSPGARAETPVTIVGVAAKGFVFPYPRGVVEVAAWQALGGDIEGSDPERSFNLMAVGRLRPDAALQTAQAQLEVLSGRLASAKPDPHKGYSLRAIRLNDNIAGTLRAPILLFLAGVALLLLVACGNVANLVLARSVTREQQLAVRAALGAGRWHLASESLLESLMLVVSASVLGFLFAEGIVAAFLALAPEKFPRLDEVGLGARALIFAAVAGAAAVLLLGALPAWQASRAAVRPLGRGLGARQAGTVRGSLGTIVAVELALAVVLLLAGGVLGRSFLALVRVDLGFEPSSVVAFDLRRSPPPRPAPGARRPAPIDYARPEVALNEGERRQAALNLDLERRVSAVPGVTAAGLTSQLPLGGMSGSQDVQIDGRAPSSNASMDAMIAVRRASPGYFRAIGLRLAAGRWFTDRDGEGAVRVAVVNQTMARTYWDGAALGKGLHLGSAPARVVGIVADSRHSGPQQPAEPEIFVCSLQDPFALTLVVRGSGGAAGLRAAIEREVKAAGLGTEVVRVRELETLLSEAVAVPRVAAFVLGTFSLLALLIAVAGVHGVLEYAVARRTREIGIRLALGARPDGIVRLILRQALVYAAAGVVGGLSVALLFPSALGSLVYGVRPTDPTSAALACLLLLGAVVVAAWRPARRASRIDAALSLRSE
jgi:putative ABC transport system permease protein